MTVPPIDERRRFHDSPLALASDFAAPERASRREVELSREMIRSHGLLTAVLDGVGVPAAIVNRQRQILFANDSLARTLGAVPGDLEGLRSGEALGCVNSWKNPAGCGTSLECATCGMGRAVVAALSQGAVVEDECSLNLERDGAPDAIELAVRAAPLVLDGGTFVVLSLRDVSAEKRRDALEQVFFHDLANTLTALRGSTSSRDASVEDPEAPRRIARLVERVVRQVENQRALRLAEKGTLPVVLEAVPVRRVLRSAQQEIEGLAGPRRIAVEVSEPNESPAITTDESHLLRVLANMGKNAVEATLGGGAVRLRAAATGEGVVFAVWNAGGIPPAVARRVFQRSFSTKAQQGRGLGTYSMRLFGERYLGGKVGFRTDEREGTEFFIELPAGGPRAK